MELTHSRVQFPRGGSAHRRRENTANPSRKQDWKLASSQQQRHSHQPAAQHASLAPQQPEHGEQGLLPRSSSFEPQTLQGPQVGPTVVYVVPVLVYSLLSNVHSCNRGTKEVRTERVPVVHVGMFRVSVWSAYCKAVRMRKLQTADLTSRFLGRREVGVHLVCIPRDFYCTRCCCCHRLCVHVVFRFRYWCLPCRTGRDQ